MRDVPGPFISVAQNDFPRGGIECRLREGISVAVKHEEVKKRLSLASTDMQTSLKNK